MSPTKDDLGTISRTPKDDYAEEGVVIREVEEGTRCEQCNNICAGFSPHEWRKTCQSCKCPREAHAIYQEQVTSVRERLGLKPEGQTSRIEPRQLGYTWVPPGIMTSAKVQRYFDKIPQDKVPKVGTSGERYRERQITLQLPKQDLALDHCKHIESQHRASYEDFVAARNEIALDIGYIKDAPQSTKCVNCDDRIAKGDLAVIAPKFRDQMMWHPKCFSCATCDELLVDLTYCVHEEKIYCERHYAELLKPRCNACDEDKKSSEKHIEKVSNPPSQSEAGLQGVLIEQKTSAGTEETVACEETGDARQNTGLRRSPRLDDIDNYEKRLREEDENAKVRAILPSVQPCDNKLENPLLTEPQTDVTQAGSKQISPTPERQGIRSESPYKTGRPQTPVIEIIRVGSSTEKTSEEPVGLLEGISDFYDFNASINPSRSRSRSPSKERSLRQSVSSSQSESPSSKFVEKIDRNKIPFNTNDLSGLSGFYDFCVMMNHHAYGHYFQRAHSAHRSSTDYLESKLKARKSKSKSPSHLLSAPKNGVASLPEAGGGIQNHENSPPTQNTPLTVEGLNIELYKRSESPCPSSEEKQGHNTSSIPPTPTSLKHFNSRDTFYTASTPLEMPETPEFQRSFSANMRYLEQMKDEYRTNAFKRSTYVGESMDFENDFEELRERTRLFKRSRSRSRSPLLEDMMDPCTSKQAAQRELQDKILEEITKTTIHYQDFSRDMAQRFIDQDRRGSDSALLQKESIPIEDNLRQNALQSDEDLLNELEGEEYHHFRRFSLNLESQEDDYSDDNNCVFLEEINVQIPAGTRSWTRMDFYDKDDCNNLETEPEPSSTTSLDITGTDSDHAEADDIDTESEDDRQTVVEVDDEIDEIDEDVFDYERPEEQSNEQSECEEADREMDRYANKNANDWNDEGAIGGFALPIQKYENDSINIDQMYNDAVKNTEESGIEKDYETIVEAMNEEEQLSRNSTETKDIMSVTTEDLLDEILREDERLSSHRSSRRAQIEATSNFINYEVSREVLSKSSTTSTTTSSTRLRSRYGYGPAIVHRNYDDLDDLNVDIDYKPKKEYKWRQNFKLDDEESCERAESSENQNTECNSNSDLNLGELENEEENEQTKNNEASWSEESKSLQNDYNFEKLNDEDEDNGTRKGAIKKQRMVQDEISNKREESIPEKEELKPSKNDENDKALRKKKTKRKTRRGSKISLGNETDHNEITSPQNDESKESNPENRLNRKPKRKKKILETISPPSPNSVSTNFVQDTTLKPMESKDPSGTNLKSPSSPLANALFDTTHFQSHTKSLSHSLAKTPPPASNSSTPNMQPLDKLPEASITSVHLTATSDAGESKSKSKSSSPKPATSNGSISTQPATPPRPQLERNDSSGVYELIKDGSMYPWF